MRDYEAILILKAHLGEDVYKKSTDTFQEWITKNEGTVIKFDAMGTRDLPETFKKHTKGYYFLCQFSGSNLTLDTIKENMRVDENYIRHLIVRMDSIYETKTAEKEA